MVLWNVRSKLSLAGIWEPGGRILEEEKCLGEGAGIRPGGVLQVVSPCFCHCSLQ